MAFNVGKAPAAILQRALTDNIFVEKSLAYMNEGDKDGYNVYKHDIKNVLKARTADPAASISNTHKKFNFKRSLTEVESIEDFDPKDYHSYWLEYQPDGNFQWEGLPSEVQSSMEELFLGTAAEAVEDMLTNGSADPAITGLIPQLRSTALTSLNGAEATPTQRTENTTISFRAHGGGTGENLGEALTADNVFEKLELLIKRQSKSMRKRANRKFMVSQAAFDLIMEAQRLKLNFKGVDVTDEGVARYAGYEIIANPSFPEHDILLASMSGNMNTDAIQLGTSMSSDFNNLTVDRLSNFSRKWAMCLTFALDIFLVRPEEVCYYTDQVIA